MFSKNISLASVFLITAFSSSAFANNVLWSCKSNANFPNGTSGQSLTQIVQNADGFFMNTQINRGENVQAESFPASKITVNTYKIRANFSAVINSDTEPTDLNEGEKAIGIFYIKKTGVTDATVVVNVNRIDHVKLYQEPTSGLFPIMNSAVTEAYDANGKLLGTFQSGTMAMIISGAADCKAGDQSF